MVTRLAALLVAVGALAAGGCGGTTTPTSTAKQGSGHAVAVRFHAGERCKASSEGLYRAYGFRCAHGRLERAS